MLDSGGIEPARNAARSCKVLMVPEACRFWATPMDVAEWLRGVGLEQYAPAFRDNDIDWEVLHRGSRSVPRGTVG